MDAAPRVNILDFCEEHYKDILPIIMDKIRHDKPKVRDHLKDNDGNVFGRLGHRRQSAFDRLSDTYSPSTTKSRPDMTSSRDHSHSRGRPHRRDSSLSRGRPRSRDRSHGIEESYDNTYSSYRTSARHGHHSRIVNPLVTRKREGKRIPVISCIRQWYQRWGILEVNVKKAQAYR
ncbi:hypothetical protein Tco_0276587 [Tanacetum coccineum]